MEEVHEITRWRRYGKDRLYVGRADGTKVGWWDLQADDGHPESEEYAAELGEAVRRWRAGIESDESTDAPAGMVPVMMVQEVAPAPEPLPEAPAVEPARPARPWLDLATNVAGEAAREQALAAKEAAPVRTLVARVMRVHTDERAWRIGADGEERVASQFDKVLKKDPRWQFIHAIPVGTRGSDIDHLVIGPGGVFTVNTKNHPNAKLWVGGDTFLVNGNRQPYVRNARHEAARVAKLLTEACGFPVHVEGVIAPVNAIEVTVKTPPKDVHVVPRRQIAKWLLRHGDVVPAEQQATLFGVARRSTTWK
ncbi:NERD domain-containing protein [Nocardioides koreensis]|uniref:NERD domain-containing protein n=1 Tax=Nocardioides koreensis TaxID=433651 RepID=A0ABN2ZU14_9ACTN